MMERLLLVQKAGSFPAELLVKQSFTLIIGLSSFQRTSRWEPNLRMNHFPASDFLEVLQ
jgi:hypothetical protein